MNILVLIKQVPDTEANISVSGGKVNESGIKWIISPYDEIGLEEALRCREQKGGTVTVLTVGGEQAISVLRTAYAMGADNAIHIKNENYNMLDSAVIAEAITSAISNEKYDIIFAGRQGSDSDNGQAPLIIAEKMNIAAVSYAKKVELGDDKITITAEAEGGQGIYESAYPVIITANAGLNEPRYPSLKGIMASKKKPIDTKTFEDLGIKAESKIEVLGFSPPPERPAGKIIEGEDAAAKAKELARLLHEEVKVI
ncbi:MAG: electron transfer flavoprotein subunit beta/FixA family protein [Spirochaetia bacterium]|nr:electron transfer flavoprotein subunit beta/FixA family protein [Spirochaetia bacterium]